MNHGDHSEHGGHSMPGMDHDMPACSMNMLWNNQIADTCVVFQSWHISGPMTMALSCIAVIAISFGYSTLLHSIKTFDRRIALSLYQTSAPNRRESVHPNGVRRESSIPPAQSGYSAVEGGALAKAGVTRLSLSTRLTRAALYAISVGLSFWLMLVAMTYNTYLFMSIIVGAFLGHVMYEAEIDVGSVLAGGNSKGLACH
ncbi:uncharacterized protein I303_100619 [Kwoniella dejecticola CBS 10117]|uniref:Copper transport protein n=1 Tax=Kwoniella dejecticola CBS 10117 TaxID=1296121 RepID=A0A1A6AFF8_9TREE|nr:solute carrier family 31 (copper transporter), member 1 [Kwoniella dejecticola CBS 10117]OBR88805.1 solute carrier family 31 (copper transporter), member 1 [Kwoniella dejecticola CBS 10117]